MRQFQSFSFVVFGVLLGAASASAVLAVWSRTYVGSVSSLAAQPEVTSPLRAEGSAVRDTSVTVLLDGFTAEHYGIESSPYVPRWSSLAFPVIHAPSDCDRLWQSYSVYGDPPSECLEMRSGADENIVRQVRTCAEWARAFNDGFVVRNNYQVGVESVLIPWAGVLPNLPHMLCSEKSTFRDLDLWSFARKILPPGVEREELARPGDGEHWVVQGNSIRREETGWLSWAEPMALGDLDGDGWEDMLLRVAERATQGSFHAFDNMLVARRDDGRLVSIAGRMAQVPCTDAQMELRRAEWRANFGLPIDTDIELQGKCGCGPIAVESRTHPLHVRLRSNGGYLTGSYRCDVNNREIPLAGALWTGSSGILHEFAIDDAWTASIEFDWRIEQGLLFIDGLRGGISQIERDEWSAKGQVSRKPVDISAR